MTLKKILITGASGYIASQILSVFKKKYQTILLDVTNQNRTGQTLKNVVSIDLLDPDRSQYAQYFEGVSTVLHLGYKRRRSDPLDQFFCEKANVEMAYNVFRTAYEAGVDRVVMASSNHAADWYEHSLIHAKKMEIVEPYQLPLSDNFYGWSKASYEHMGFLFACGGLGVQGSSDGYVHTKGNYTGRKMGVVMVRIGAPRDLNIAEYRGDLVTYKRDLGAYISPRDLTQLFMKAIETSDIDNGHGIPWQIVYGISNNTRAFWSLVNAREVLNYDPKDDSEIKFAEDIHKVIVTTPYPMAAGKLGPI